jgi:hypothetical protein
LFFALCACTSHDHYATANTTEMEEVDYEQSVWKIREYDVLMDFVCVKRPLI